MSVKTGSQDEKAAVDLDDAPPYDAHIEQPVSPHEEDFAWNKDVITNLLALYLVYFASSWAMSVPSSSIAFIMYEFPGDHSTTGWIAAGPSFCLCIIQIFIGDISDLFGRKWFLLIGSASGLTGLLLAGRATNIATIIGGQVLNGIGLTLGFLSTPLLAEVVPKRSRATIIGGGTLLAVLSATGGQIIQGACMKNGVGGANKGWRVGFYIGAGLWGLALIATFIFYHPGPRLNPEGHSTRTRLFKIDWLGIFLGTTGLLFILLGLQFGGNPDPWTSARVLCFLIIGLVAIVIFALWEWKGVDEGLFPKSLFEHRNYGVTIVLNFAEGMVIFSSQAFVPQIILSLLTKDLVLSAVYNLTNAGGSIIGVAVAATVVAMTKEAKWIAVGGVLALTLGGGLMAVMQPGISFAAWFFPSTLIGVGIGSLGVIIPVISSVCTPDRYIATSVAIGTSVRGLGGSIGIVVFMQIFRVKLTKFMPERIGTAVMAAGLPQSSIGDLIMASMTHDQELMASIPGVTDEVLSALDAGTAQAYADSYRFIWYGLIPFAVVTLVISLFLKSTKKQMTKRVASRVQQHYVQEPVLKGKEIEE